MDTGLASHQAIIGSFSESQNRAILIVGLTCSCLSFVVTLVTLRWFILMKRLFRHRLIMLLVFSDTFKAVWYFVFPVVVFANHPIDTADHFCQATGYLLSLAIEASDCAILLLAIHSVLYVFRPPASLGSGGLHPYRRWIPLMWLTFPVLSASLAFINRPHAFVTAGLYCYLPQRPFWYRLALAWIPRYVIISAILAMYVAIFIYVHVKFQGFKNVMGSGSSGSELRQSYHGSEGAVDEEKSTSPDLQRKGLRISFKPPRGAAGSTTQSRSGSPQMDEASAQPWDRIDFITSTGLQQGVTTPFSFNDWATRGSESTDTTRVGPGLPRNPSVNPTDASESRKESEVPTMNTGSTESNSIRYSGPPKSALDDDQLRLVDPLQRTRQAIRQQLRFMFIYPAVYIIMWIFPLANFCLLYNGNSASHPLFWLQVLTTISMSFQAAADCIVFSWREKPWRRIDNESIFSVPFWHNKSTSFVKSLSRHGSAALSPGRRLSSAIKERRASTAASRAFSLSSPHSARRPNLNRNATWWEAEGRKRKDSVWLGTDLMTQIISRSSAENGDGRGDGDDNRVSSEQVNAPISDSLRGGSPSNGHDDEDYHNQATDGNKI